MESRGTKPIILVGPMMPDAPVAAGRGETRRFERLIDPDR
jgi:hypothetical protein